MILTISDSEEGILNKIKSVLACESTLEVMEITNSEKLTFQGLEIDQLTGLCISRRRFRMR